MDRKPRTAHPVTEPTTASRPAAALVKVRRLFTPEHANFTMLLGITVFMVGFGLLMVLSSSAITSYRQNDEDFFYTASRQAMFAIIGLPLMLIASRAPQRFWKRWSNLALWGSLVIQSLIFVPGIGQSFGTSNTNWIAIGPVQGQPSEFVKIALAVWLASVISDRPEIVSDWKALLKTVGLPIGLALGLVLAGGDLGTAIVIGLIAFGALFVAGVRLRVLMLPIVVGALLATIVTMSSDSRSGRVMTFLNGGCASVDDADQACWQTVHGLYALATGGVFGVGLGNSRAKWSWLPHSETDYIFAIIGEELGLIGAIVVLLLFVVLAIALLRITRATPSPYVKIAVTAIMVWMIGQAFMNIAVVLTLLPVIGVPLPLISQGGSALVANLLAIGIALSFARRPDGEQITDGASAS